MTIEEKGKKGKDSESLRTVQRALDILDCFSITEPELTLTEIASKINLAKSTTTRLLSTLEHNGYVAKDAQTLKYKLAHKLYFLGHVAGKSIQLRDVAAPVMTEMRDETRETINLYIIEDEYRICIEQMEGLEALRSLIKIGDRLPLWSGASGKVLLAFQSAEFQNQVLEKNVHRDERRKQLKSELQAIQLEQVAVSQEEREFGLASVAAPVYGVDGSVKASLAISGPLQRFTLSRIEQYKELVKREALNISRGNGYRPLG